MTVADYAAKAKINPSAASGRLYAAPLALEDHYERLTDTEEKQQESHHKYRTIFAGRTVKEPTMTDTPTNRNFPNAPPS